MQTRSLGKLKINVSRIGLGAMPLSIDGRPDEKDALKVLHAAFDAGMTLIDTANVYCLDDSDIGHNERLIAKALKSWSGQEEAIVVATKGGLTRPQGAWKRDGRPEHLKKACENSLRALGVDAITLYQLHAPDEDVPFEDSVGALADLRKQGKIQNAGLSNVNADEVKKAEKIIPVLSVQNQCNVFDRTSFNNGVVAYCENRGMAFLPYSPVGGHFTHANTPEHPVLKTVAARYDATPYQICLAWLLAVSPAIIPIPGARRIPSATSSAAAASLRLSQEDVQTLTRLVH